MKKFLIILTLFAIFLVFSCSSKSESKNDSDATSDADSDLIETVDDDSDYQDSDFIDDSDDDDDSETDDSDSDTDEPLDVDYQGAEDCPKLSEAKFPYYNDDKSIHFCRKCDTPTVKDPQCMENLWKEAAARLYAVSPESECKDGYPCEMLDLVPITQAEWDEEWSDPKYPKLPYRPHECDLILDANSVSTKYLWATDETAGSFKHFNISDGKIGIKLKNVSTRLYGQVTRSKVMIYDPVNKKYRAIAPMFDDELAYHKGCFLYMGSDFRKIDGEERYLFKKRVCL